MLDRQNSDHIAIDPVGTYGRRARQLVADNILDAVRNHDMPSAKYWNEIGCAVDARLDRAEQRRHTLTEHDPFTTSPEHLADFCIGRSAWGSVVSFHAKMPRQNL